MNFLRARFSQLLRYGAVSLISTSASMVILGVLVATRTVTAGWANVIATAVGTVPSFELNRRWVWGRTGSRSVGREVVPFTVLSFAGLGISTVLVSLAASFADARGLTDLTRTVFAEGASLAAFGSLWVLQFFVLDRVLFRPSPTRPMRTTSHATALRAPAPTID
jgi:putative flippase GtrA